ncbi:hypothetical protein GF327_05320 [Candidatus Woesearchaeota archaeon]|nr:hypothetical protein [Candidatus Woesearchaeota archaeon]
MIVLACGSGVQTIGDLIDKPVISGLDSKYIGEIKRIGNFTEKCSACGQCILNDYYGICPITRCAKHLLNGPCGGSFNKKCEEDPDKDCVWALILERMKKTGLNKKLDEYKEPKKWE